MKETEQFTDEEITAYLDGEKDFAPFSRIDTALKTDPEFASRVDALRIDKSALTVAYGALTPKVEPLHETRGYSFSSLAAAALVALAIGFGSSTWLNVKKEPDWQDYVAAYQALYSTQTLANVQRGEGELASELKRVSAAIGIDIDVAQLTSADGVSYKRSQVLSFKGQPLIQLAFLSKDGTPVALCILRSGQPEAENPVRFSMEGMKAASWSKKGFEFLLIGGENDRFISDLADGFSKAI